MKTTLMVILLLIPAQVTAEPENKKFVKTPTTYKECIQRASDMNSKWINYKADVNKCRGTFGVPGEY